MGHRARAVCLAVAALLAAPFAFAASIIPPENLGELALRSHAVVLARAGEARVVRRGPLYFTHTPFQTLETIVGQVVAGTKLTVETPGGQLPNGGWLVPGSPEFAAGTVYLLFLEPRANGLWQPKLLSYGLLERVLGRDGSHLLAPLPDVGGVQPFARSDGIVPEEIGTYREIALLPHLAQVAKRQALWDSSKVLASSTQIRLRATVFAPPLGCTYIGGPPYWRWPYNTGSSPGQITMRSDSAGDPSLAGTGEFTAVAGAVANWMGVPNTSLNLAYGGEANSGLSGTCDGIYNEATDENDSTVPESSVGFVVFNDPCSDIADLSGCSGTLAFGGVGWYGNTHTFDGTTWYSIGAWYIVVNNGSGCMGLSDYQTMLTHEMGHGLGFGHYSDPNALMYYMCCNNINATDTTCAQYTYPSGTPVPPTPTTPPGTPTATPTPGGPTPTPGGPTATPTPTQPVLGAPTNVQATDGTYTDKVQVSWSPVTGAVSYRVYRNTSSSSASATQIGMPSGTLFNDLTAVAGTTYWYWVRAVNSGGGLSAYSTPDTGFRSTGGTPTPVTPTYTPTPVTPTYTPTPTNPPGPTFTPTPAVTPTPSTVPASNVAVVAHNTGTGGTAWRSDVMLSNPSDGALAVDLRYKASGGVVTTRGLSLAARETRMLGDVLVSFFGLGDGRGALQVVPPTGGVAPAVASRTYNQTAAGNLGFGTVSLVPPAAGTYYVPGLYADTVARTNLGVTAGATGTNATVTLYRGTTGVVGSAVSLWIGANDQQQWAVQDLFPGLALPGVPMSVSVRTDGAAHAYATQVDQASGDTVFLSGSLSANSWLIPVVAHNSGAGGTYWRTDLYLFNPLALSNAVTLEYLPEGRDNSGGGTATANVTLGPFASQTIADLVGTRFGVTQGKGSLAITASRPVIAASRCYTTRTLGGTLGFGAPAVLPAALHTATRTLPGVRALDGYRTNVGLVTGTAGANVTLRLRNANGAVLATNSTIWVPPRTLYQASLGDLFGAATPNPVGAVEISTNAPLGAYLSVIDGSSQDPILVLAP